MMSGRSRVARRFMLVSVVFAPLVLSSTSPLLADSGVAVTVNKVRPGKGLVHITLVNKAQFLMRKKLKKPLMKGIVKPLGKSVQYEFKDVPPGGLRDSGAAGLRRGRIHDQQLAGSP